MVSTMFCNSLFDKSRHSSAIASLSSQTFWRGCPRDSRWGSDLATTMANPKHASSFSETIPQWILKRGKVRYLTETSHFSLQSDEPQTEDLFEVFLRVDISIEKHNLSSTIMSKACLSHDRPTSKRTLGNVNRFLAKVMPVTTVAIRTIRIPLIFIAEDNLAPFE